MIIIKYEELLTLAKTIEEKRNDLNRDLKETESVLFLLSDIWDSELSSKYINEYMTLSDSFNDLDKLLKAITKNMTAIANYCDHIKRINNE
jgi:uncharacterized protein YukE